MNDPIAKNLLFGMFVITLWFETDMEYNRLIRKVQKLSPIFKAKPSRFILSVKAKLK